MAKLRMGECLTLITDDPARASEFRQDALARMGDELRDDRPGSPFVDERGCTCQNHVGGFVTVCNCGARRDSGVENNITAPRGPSVFALSRQRNDAAKTVVSEEDAPAPRSVFARSRARADAARTRE